MERIGKIELEGMEFRAYHGCFEEERTAGNLFVVDFTGEIDMAAAVETDALADTADYGAVYSVIKREMSSPSDLLEHVAGRIVKAIESEIPAFTRFSVRISKSNPPVGGVCAWSRVTLNGGKTLS